MNICRFQRKHNYLFSQPYHPFDSSVSCKIPSSGGGGGGSGTHKKPYDPLQFTEKLDNAALKEAHHKLKLLEFDYKALHDKRLQDVSKRNHRTEKAEERKDKSTKNHCISSSNFHSS